MVRPSATARLCCGFGLTDLCLAVRIRGESLDLKFDIEAVKGFLDPTEGRALFDHAVATAAHGPCLEIGSYCGKSTVYLGTACARTGNTLYAIDHHQGSEEHQPGEEYHDEALFDVDRNKVDTFRYFRETIAAADLVSVVVPIVAPSAVAGRHWGTSLGLVFIDGGIVGKRRMRITTSGRDISSMVDDY